MANTPNRARKPSGSARFKREEMGDQPLSTQQSLMHLRFAGAPILGIAWLSPSPEYAFFLDFIDEDTVVVRWEWRARCW